MRQFLLGVFCVFTFLSVNAQQFNVEMNGYSTKKITYVTFNDGTKKEIDLGFKNNSMVSSPLDSFYFFCFLISFLCVGISIE